MPDTTPPLTSVEAASPMPVINTPSERHTTPEEPIPVEVWVRHHPDAPDGWYYGELAEWTRYPEHGWTAWVRYTLGPGDRRTGTFTAACVRPLDGDAARPGDSDATDGRPR